MKSLNEIKEEELHEYGRHGRGRMGGRTFVGLKTQKAMASDGYPAVTKGQEYSPTSPTSDYFLDDDEVWKHIENSIKNGLIEEI